MIDTVASCFFRAEQQKSGKIVPEKGKHGKIFTARTNHGTPKRECRNRDHWGLGVPGFWNVYRDDALTIDILAINPPYVKIAMASSSACDIIDRKTLHSVRYAHASLSCKTVVWIVRGTA